MKMVLRGFLFLLGVVVLVGCSRLDNGNNGQLQSYPFLPVEAGWIRNGEVLEFEGRQWLPTDDVENLLDEEMYQVGEYKGVQVFVEKVDTKPYSRMYTKFAKGKFRYFERARND